MATNGWGLTKFFALLKCSNQGIMLIGKKFCLSPCYKLFKKRKKRGDFFIKFFKF